MEGNQQYFPCFNPLPLASVAQFVEGNYLVVEFEAVRSYLPDLIFT
jgi:hypothetical protein